MIRDLNVTPRQWVGCFAGALGMILGGWLGLVLMLILGGAGR